MPKQLKWSRYESALPQSLSDHLGFGDERLLLRQVERVCVVEMLIPAQKTWPKLHQAAPNNSFSTAVRTISRKLDH